MNISRRQFERAALAAILGNRSLRAQQLAPPPPPKDVPWLKEIQTPPATLPADGPKLASVMVDAGNKPITTRTDWLEQRKQVRQLWRELLGAYDPPPAVPQFEIVETDRTAGVSR